MPKKKMTIEDLARMVQRGFLQLEDKFDRMEERMKLHEEFTREGFKRIDSELRDMRARIDQLFEAVDEDTRAQYQEIIKLKRRTDLLEKEFKVLKTQKA